MESEALAKALPGRLTVLQLRLTDFNLSLEELRQAEAAKPLSQNCWKKMP